MDILDCLLPVSSPNYISYNALKNKLHNRLVLFDEMISLPTTKHLVFDAIRGFQPYQKSRSFGMPVLCCQVERRGPEPIGRYWSTFGKQSTYFGLVSIAGGAQELLPKLNQGCVRNTFNSRKA